MLPLVSRAPSVRALRGLRVIRQVRHMSQGDRRIPISPSQRLTLAAGSAVFSIIDPTRADMVAILGETTGGPFLKRLRKTMEADPSGQKILNERPRVTEENVNMSYLRSLPEDSFGYHYVQFLDNNDIGPAGRSPVKYVEHETEAYVMQRYREVHDFVHVLAGLPHITVVSEIAIKCLEWTQTGLPMCAMSALFGPLRLPLNEKIYIGTHVLPWALACSTSLKTNLVSVYYEKHFETPIKTLRQDTGIIVAPNPPTEREPEM